MKSNRVTFAFFASLIITIALSFLPAPNDAAVANIRFMTTIGAVILLNFAWLFVIASRFNFMEKYYKPIDKLYINHKILGFVTLILVISHKQLNAPNTIEAVAVSTAARIGFASFVAMILLIILTVIGYVYVVKIGKGNYQIWKKLHGLILIPYFIGVIHYFSNSKIEVFTIGAFQLWMFVIIVIGSITGLYSVFGYEIIAFRNRYEVTEVRALNDKVSEIVLDKKITPGFKPGQFGFFKFYNKGIGKEVHPFTLTCGSSQYIAFTPKALGDFTKKINTNITVGDKVAFDGPYGGFDYEAGHAKQLWIAGGIGITPFVSFIRSGINPDFSVDFFYSYRNTENEIYDTEISGKKGFRYTAHNSKAQGRLDFKVILSTYDDDIPLTVCYCGPVAMRVALEKALKESDLKSYELIFDNFSF